MSFENVYGDAERAAAYAKLEFPGTYYLAYRDLPQILEKHAHGRRAIDFGCGTGRSSRFLTRLGFDTVGVDISAEMIGNARRLDPDGEYHLIADGDMNLFPTGSVDLVLSAFTFDNIPTATAKKKNLAAIRRLLRSDGVMVNLVSTPEIYTHEWASFTTKDFPENRKADSGEKVRIIMKDVDDRRPVEDIVYSDKSYRELYNQVGLEVTATYRPLAKESEPYQWISETTVAPWAIYVLTRQ